MQTFKEYINESKGWKQYDLDFPREWNVVLKGNNMNIDFDFERLNVSKKILEVADVHAQVWGRKTERKLDLLFLLIQWVKTMILHIRNLLMT